MGTLGRKLEFSPVWGGGAIAPSGAIPGGAVAQRADSDNAEVEVESCTFPIRIIIYEYFDRIIYDC